MNVVRTTLAAALGAVVLAGAAAAQAPKRFDWFEENVSLGFKIRVPEDWNVIPPNPDEHQMLAEFAHPTQFRINVGPQDTLDLYGWLVKFDRRPDADGEPRRPRHKDVEAWINDKSKTGARRWTLVEEEEVKRVDVPATQYVFEGPNIRGPNRPLIRCFAAVFTIDDDLEVAMVFNGPPEDDWRKYGRAFEKMARSFELIPIEAVEVEAPEGVGSGSLRAQKRVRLARECASMPGWELYETPNYFVVSNNDDEDFLEELMERLEAIRAVYEEQYPPEKARRVRDEPESPEADAGAADEDEDEEEEDGEEEMRSVSVQADPLERSRTSVVRVCGDRDQYVDYGGPGGSAGYWHSGHEELVVYDAQMVRGRDFTWEVLNHEAFHQYIYYFYGNIAPHSWYNEGTGDYFSGFEYKRRKFVESEARGRQRHVQQMIRDESYAPLKEFVRWSKREYYGSNALGLSGLDCYAQGWSLIWFLRTGERHNAPGWDDDWNDILDVYLETLARTGDLDEAVDAAFAGVDWEEFEDSWRDYVE